MRARCGACVFRLDAGTGLVAVFLYVSENWRCFRISKQGHQINEEIRDKEVRLVSDTGEQLGIMSAREALERHGRESGPGEDLSHRESPRL